MRGGSKKVELCNTLTKFSFLGDKSNPSIEAEELNAPGQTFYFKIKGGSGKTSASSTTTTSTTTSTTTTTTNSDLVYHIVPHTSQDPLAVGAGKVENLNKTTEKNTTATASTTTSTTTTTTTTTTNPELVYHIVPHTEVPPEQGQ